MNRATALALSWFVMCVPASGLVGDAPTAEWTIRRQTVMVFGSRARCSGVIVMRDLILTAAHCVTAPDKYRIVGQADVQASTLADVTETASHPQFRRETGPIVADLALLKLSKLTPTALGTAFFALRPFAIGERLIVVGYGVSENSGKETALERGSIDAMYIPIGYT